MIHHLHAFKFSALCYFVYLSHVFFCFWQQHLDDKHLSRFLEAEGVVNSTVHDDLKEGADASDSASASGASQ